MICLPTCTVLHLIFNILAKKMGAYWKEGTELRGVLITLLYWLPLDWGNRNRFSLCSYYLGKWGRRGEVLLLLRCKSHINLVNNLTGYRVPCSSVDKEFENDNRLEIIPLPWLEFMPFKYVLCPHSWQLSNS